MPLEPIEEKDLDLEKKFIEQAPADGTEEMVAKKVVSEIPVSEEKNIERKEGAAEKDGVYAKILSKVKTQSAPTNDTDVAQDADMTSKEMDVEAKVNNLVNIAMQKGVVHAVKVARHLDDNYMLDEFHDKMMADELHDALIEKGLIKEI